MIKERYNEVDRNPRFVVRLFGKIISKWISLSEASGCKQEVEILGKS